METTSPFAIVARIAALIEALFSSIRLGATHPDAWNEALTRDFAWLIQLSPHAHGSDGPMQARPRDPQTAAPATLPPGFGRIIRPPCLMPALAPHSPWAMRAGLPTRHAALFSRLATFGRPRRERGPKNA